MALIKKGVKLKNSAFYHYARTLGFFCTTLCAAFTALNIRMSATVFRYYDYLNT